MTTTPLNKSKVCANSIKKITSQYSAHSLALWLGLTCVCLQYLTHYYAMVYLGKYWQAQHQYSQALLGSLIPFHIATTCFTSLVLPVKLSNVNHQKLLQLSMLIAAMACALINLPHPFFLISSYILNAFCCGLSTFSVNIMIGLTSATEKLKWGTCLSLTYSFSALLSMLNYSVNKQYLVSNIYFPMQAIVLAGFAFLLFFIKFPTQHASTKEQTAKTYVQVFNSPLFRQTWINMAAIYTITLYFMISHHGFDSLNHMIQLDESHQFWFMFFAYSATLISRVMVIKLAKKIHNFESMPLIPLFTLLVSLLIFTLPPKLSLLVSSFFLMGFSGGLVGPSIYWASLHFSSRQVQLCAQATLPALHLFSSIALSLIIFIKSQHQLTMNTLVPAGILMIMVCITLQLKKITSSRTSNPESA